MSNIREGRPLRFTRFAQLERRSYKTSKKRKNEIASEVERLFKRYTQRNGHEYPKNPLAYKRAMAVIMETVFDCVKILGLTEIPWVSISPTLQSIASIDGDGIMRVNSQFFQERCKNLTDPNLPWSDKHMYELREVIAHEMYHPKARRDHPATAERTRHANHLLNTTGRREAYDKDRGELAANLFGTAYASYKRGNQDFLDLVDGHGS